MSSRTVFRFSIQIASMGPSPQLQKSCWPHDCLQAEGSTNNPGVVLQCTIVALLPYRGKPLQHHAWKQSSEQLQEPISETPVPGTPGVHSSPRVHAFVQSDRDFASTACFRLVLLIFRTLNQPSTVPVSRMPSAFRYRSVNN